MLQSRAHNLRPRCLGLMLLTVTGLGRADGSVDADYSTDQLQLDLARQTDVAVSATALLESVQILASAPVDVVDILFDADRTPAERVEAAVQALQAYFFEEVSAEPIADNATQANFELIAPAHAAPLSRPQLKAEHIVFAEVPTEGVAGRVGFRFMGQMVSAPPGGYFVIEVPGHHRTRVEVGVIRYLDPKHIEVMITPAGEPARRLVWRTA